MADVLSILAECGMDITQMKNSQVFTPVNIVKDMVDLLPTDIFRPNATFLDPAVKSGRFLLEIKDRLMASDTMIQAFPNEADRIYHILTKQLYGIALSNTAASLARSSLYGDPLEDRNIQTIQRYIPKVRDKETDYKKLLEGVFGQMKFDVVIGNPPYQESSERGTQGSVSIYNNFMQISDIVSKQYACMIVPARWVCNAGSRGISKDWIEGELNCNNYREIHIIENSKEVFKSVDIKGGVMYYLKDSSFSGKCSINGEMRHLNDAGIGKFVYSSTESKIILKIKKISGQFMNSIVSSYSPFGIQSNAVCMSTGDIKLHKARGEVERIGKDDICKGLDILGKYKILAPLSYGDGKKGEVLNNIKVVGPNEACTSSYVAIYPSTEVEPVNNLSKYMRTRVFNLLIGIIKVTQSASKEVYQLVPLQDFTSNSDIDWTKSVAEIDKQLYKKYNFDKDEIEYIEQTIKPME